MTTALKTALISVISRPLSVNPRLSRHSRVPALAKAGGGNPGAPNPLDPRMREDDDCGPWIPGTSPRMTPGGPRMTQCGPRMTSVHDVN